MYNVVENSTIVLKHYYKVDERGKKSYSILTKQVCIQCDVSPCMRNEVQSNIR